MKIVRLLLVLACALVPFAGHAQTIKIGFITSYSGLNGNLGPYMERAVRLYIKEHQKELPPGVKIELITRDDTGPNPDKAKQLAQELIAHLRPVRHERPLALHAGHGQQDERTGGVPIPGICCCFCSARSSCAVQAAPGTIWSIAISMRGSSARGRGRARRRGRSRASSEPRSHRRSTGSARRSCPPASARRRGGPDPGRTSGRGGSRSR